MLRARALLTIASVALLAGDAAPAAAQQPATERTVTAIGTGNARVRPADRRDNASIRRAVQGAVAKALPRSRARSGMRERSRRAPGSASAS